LRISLEKCIGCMRCIDICCGGAILPIGEQCTVDEDKCVECYVCQRSGICPTDAFEEVPLIWPRTLRRAFSSVSAFHKGTGITGRGTAEMKNNDVTGRYRLGEVGFTVDIGRPGIGTSFEDVEMIAMAVASLGVRFEPTNPTTKLMADTRSGRFRDDIKKERVLSCILEFKTEDSRLLSVINALKDISKNINTVFSLGCICRCRADGTAPVQAMLDEAGIFYRPNGKTNVGLGRPLIRD